MADENRGVFVGLEKLRRVFEPAVFPSQIRSPAHEQFAPMFSKQLGTHYHRV